MAKALPKYVCHKEVRALLITSIEWNSTEQHYLLHFAGSGYSPVVVSKEWVDSKGPKCGGYYVQYNNGYTSFSPAEAFEEGYTLVPE